ncbi:2OG-Fe(II) oxygenase [Marinospirillum sp. MEB164]|uniref:2OG-Fe(II) oxygenase n=1 Tax=Marinospirillum alkalitolerans TaxID=3123374 RepID=A0ABW8PT59_9GAMM
MNRHLLSTAQHLAQLNPPRPDLLAPAAQENSICFDQLIDGLVAQQWFVAPNYLPAALCADLYADLQQLRQQQALAPAGIGRGQQHLHAETVRGDLTHWLDGATPAQRTYLALMRELKDTLNRELFLGLFEYECHYALYPPGSFYKKHVDSFRGRSNRVVTTVLYLNANWQEKDAGEMRLYDPETQQPLLDVPPQAGTLVCFLSEHLPHEVLPTQAERASIAGWFRINNSLQGVIDPPS